MANLLTVVAKIFSNTLIFLLQKLHSLCNAKDNQIFSAKISMYLQYFKIEILEMLMSHKLTTSH